MADGDPLVSDINKFTIDRGAETLKRQPERSVVHAHRLVSTLTYGCKFCSYDGGRRGGRRSYGVGDGEGGDGGLSVEEVVRILQQLPKGPPIPEHVRPSPFLQCHKDCV